MKKYNYIEYSQEILSEKIRREFFKPVRSAKHTVLLSVDISFLSDLNPGIKKSLVSLLLIFMFITTSAPDSNSIIIPGSAPVEPFSRLMHAIAMVETMGNTLAYNEFENAVGIFQIRQVRIDDYNRRTGSSFLLEEMFNYENSKRVFLYFASLTGPYDFERIAKAWNGSGPKTTLYWDRIKKFL